MIIAHISDQHIRKSNLRDDEYSKVFNNLYKSLEENKPQRIVLSGDLVHDFLDLTGSQIIMCSEFLNNLAKIASIVIIRGNHDLRKSNINKIDSVEAIVRSIGNSNIQYLNETDFFNDNNITWAVWKHGEKNNSPWTKHKKYVKKEGHTYIDLFHDPINGCSSNAGFKFDSKIYYKLSDFKSDYCMFGDIHKKQYFYDKNNKIKAAYAGSLICQDFSEGDIDSEKSFHGYLLWNIEDGTVKEIPIENEYSFKTIKVNPFTDYKDLDIEIDNSTKFMRVRILWQTLPAYRTKENERLLGDYLKNKYGESIISIKHKNEFLEENKIDIIENEQLLNINDKAVQHTIFKDYLTKIGTEEDIIHEILKIDDEITSRIVVEDLTNIEWDVLKYSAKNFMSYEDLDIDLQGKEGLFQITGKNTAGKTTLALKLITYILFNETLETESRQKYGDSRFINNKLDVNFCEALMVVSANGKYYGFKRRTNITRNKQGEISGSPTVLNYYILSSPNDEMSDDNIIDKLNEEDKNKTQKEITKIIGSYENFLRTSLITSDTLNNVLSSDPATFIDSILYDAGLDIYDKKLEEFKLYQKELNTKSRITCSLENTKSQIKINEDNNILVNEEINIINAVKLPELKTRINKGNDYVEDQTKRLNKIDNEIYTLNITDVNFKIKEHGDNINEFNKNKTILEQSILTLCETYDEIKLNELTKKKDEHKQTESSLRLNIKDLERKISDENHKIEIVNGEIFNLKKEGVKLKERIVEKNNELTRYVTSKNDELNRFTVSKNDETIKFNESKNLKHPICYACRQEIIPEHLKHIDENIEKINNELKIFTDEVNNNVKEFTEEINNKIKEFTEEMHGKAREIRTRENETILAIKNVIVGYQHDIDAIVAQIKELSIQMESTLNIIGELTNQKNDSIKRKETIATIEKIPFQIENEQLKIDILNGKLDQYNKSLVQIEENKIIETKIKTGKELLEKLNIELVVLNDDLSRKKNNIENNTNKITELKKLIIEFEKQEKYDAILALYRKLIHRDGIPRQLLSNNIIPKINNELSDLLADMPFKVWLDPEDIKPKLAYYNTPNAIINAISSSGKERTFSAMGLKVALNQINAKSKSTIFLLDELSGKLLDESCDEFTQILSLIKKKMKRIFIIEHNIEVNPDYIINVERDDIGISIATIE